MSAAINKVLKIKKSIIMFKKYQTHTKNCRKSQHTSSINIKTKIRINQSDTKLERNFIKSNWIIIGLAEQIFIFSK